MPDTKISNLPLKAIPIAADTTVIVDSVGLLNAKITLGSIPVSTAVQTAIDAKVQDTIVDGVTTIAPSQNAVFDALALKADLASPALTGTPTAPTQAANDNSTNIATTAYADAKVADAINDGITTIAPSQNAVFDALALKPNSVDIQLFTVSGAWNKPTGAKWVEVYAVGGGGQGGSGRSGLAATVRCGGGGGGSGCLAIGKFEAAILAASETVTIGAGGAGGGLEQLAASTNGNAGVAGGSTTFGTLLIALGGAAGAGGTAATGTGGAAALTAATPSNYAMMAGGNASVSGGAGVAGGTTVSLGPTGGGAGGGISVADITAVGGAGGAVFPVIHTPIVAGGAAGNAPTYIGGAGNSYTQFATGFTLGTGGGGARAQSGVSAHPGGAGGGHGAGGGGASGKTNGMIANNANGGAGSPGMVLVVTHF